MNLPESSKVNKFIPKTQFYNRVFVGKKIKDDFINKIQKITWKYKLAESTLNIKKTENIEEIQVFEIELKQRVVPKNVLQTIDKAIPYPILFVISFQDEIKYGISLKENGVVSNYYFSEWGEGIDFDFTGTTLEKVYQKIVKQFVKDINQEKKDFHEVMAEDNKLKNLQEDIQRLESDLRKEKQFNRMVEINQELLNKRKQLKRIINIK
jgi:hypothetical protein